MATLRRLGPYRIYFYCHETTEQPHVQVDRDNRSAKFWLAGTGEESRVWRGGAEKDSGTGISALRADERVAGVRVSDDSLAVDLMDGRTIIVPLAWFPRLLHAAAKDRNHWQVSGGGYGIHWPDLDEDLSTEGLLRGAPLPVRRNLPGYYRARCQASASAMSWATFAVSAFRST